MTFREGPVTVSVPATSANLGPGFDTLGLALTLRDRLQAEVIGEGIEIEVEGAGAGSVPRDERHLVVRAMRVAFDALDVHPSGLRLSCHNVIPHARGLGSSSAAIVGGLALARALVVDGVERLDDSELFSLAAAMEGHPDNVAPACFGGLVIAGITATAPGVPGYFAVPTPIDPNVETVVLIPPEGVETDEARRLLPTLVSHADAATNAGRAALLVAALAGRPEHLLTATEDRLHQDYRRPAMPATLALVDALRVRGVPAIVSGAGPTVLAFTDGLDATSAEQVIAACPTGWVGLRLSVDLEGVVLH